MRSEPAINENPGENEADELDLPRHPSPLDLPGNPRIITRSEHSISRRDISSEALRVLYRLRNSGYKAFLVGGGVRDLYLGKKPKDFDVGTDARPSRIKKLFRNCRIIGRRFRIAHVYFSKTDYVEVATFRQGEVHAIQNANGVILLDNQYGTPEEDAKRRDLTINGLFYDIDSFSIIDYVEGVKDLEDRVVRTIKDPDASFQEDPVRMVRALRHAARTGFAVAPETAAGITTNRFEIQKANPSRLMEEIFKDLRGGAATPFFDRLLESGLLECFLPTLFEQLQAYGSDHPLPRRLRALDATSQTAGREFSNAVLLSTLLHTVLLPDPQGWTGDGPAPAGVWPLLQSGFRDVSQHMRISRRDAERVAQIVLAYRKLRQFARRRELSPSYQRKTYLSEALDFLELDLASLGIETEVIGEWRQEYVANRPPPAPRPRFDRRRRQRRRSPAGDKPFIDNQLIPKQLIPKPLGPKPLGPRKPGAKERGADGQPARRRGRRRGKKAKGSGSKDS